jgi:ubiquitin carboxyl-terminal hydrolase 7
VNFIELTTNGFSWQNYDGQVQHDAHELNRLLLDAMDRSLRHTPGEALCRGLYEGLSENRIWCQSCRGVSLRQEAFYDINLQVVDCADVVASLRRHCAAELLAGDSAYSCDTCRCKTQALRSTVLTKLPKVRCIIIIVKHCKPIR